MEKPDVGAENERERAEIDRNRGKMLRKVHGFAAEPPNYLKIRNHTDWILWKHDVWKTFAQGEKM